jgi:hypothetical protein
MHIVKVALLNLALSIRPAAADLTFALDVSPARTCTSV